MKRAICVALGYATIALLSVVAARMYSQQSRDDDVLRPPVAMTIRYTTTYYGSGGHDITRTSQQLLAYRGDGVVLEQKSDMQGSVSHLFFPLQRISVSVDPLYQLKTTYDLTDSQVLEASRRARGVINDPTCRFAVSQDAQLTGSQLIAGIGTLGYGRRYSKTLNAFLETTYVSPSLNCVTLKSDSKWLDDAEGAIVSRTVREAAEVTLGSPGGSLFDVPASFREVKPSEAMEARRKGHHGTSPTPDYLLRSYDKSDRAYERSLKNKSLTPP